MFCAAVSGVKRAIKKKRIFAVFGHCAKCTLAGADFAPQRFKKKTLGRANEPALVATTKPRKARGGALLRCVLQRCRGSQCWCASGLERQRLRPEDINQLMQKAASLGFLNGTRLPSVTAQVAKIQHIFFFSNVKIDSYPHLDLSKVSGKKRFNQVASDKNCS